MCCPKCGAPIDEQTAFCPNCGADCRTPAAPAYTIPTYGSSAVSSSDETSNAFHEMFSGRTFTVTAGAYVVAAAMAVISFVINLFSNFDAIKYAFKGGFMSIVSLLGNWALTASYVICAAGLVLLFLSIKNSSSIDPNAFNLLKIGNLVACGAQAAMILVMLYALVIGSEAGIEMMLLFLGIIAMYLLAIFVHYTIFRRVEAWESAVNDEPLDQVNVAVPMSMIVYGGAMLVLGYFAMLGLSTMGGSELGSLVSEGFLGVITAFGMAIANLFGGLMFFQSNAKSQELRAVANARNR